jgi:phosphocarrier protein HPr
MDGLYEITKKEDHYSVFVRVENQYGLHARPSALVVGQAKRYPGTEISLYSEEGKSADASSIFDLMELGATFDKKIEIRAKGNDAEEALDKLVELFQNKFDEE